MCNLHWYYTYRKGGKHCFALCYIRPALLSANLTRVPFSCILSNVIHDSFIIDTSLITCKLRFFRRISWITTFSWKKKIAECHCAWVLCWEAINHSPVCDFIKKKPSVFEHRASTIKLCTLCAGLQWFQKFTQPDDSTVYYTYRTHKNKNNTWKSSGKKIPNYDQGSRCNYDLKNHGP